ncbi:trehalose-phosphatase [Falsirhodobacter halotolerans]|uniref:trehalose-phosphatase n=1 Tax=Falsirhodobacter halotolerans TaxID=1146892 RepID=UPI001FD07B63|nr:trehalose-phosphatase [Falsirhodobacter halotolerans]MCJ8138244.1 trehalose-phosphatase [Falsirhodobacter halotolerans]
MPHPLDPVRDAPDRFALFLDIDGCLIDLADTPDGIVIPDGLPDLLMRVSDRQGGALALVTGRQATWVDRTFAPHNFPLAALHGFQRRLPGNPLSALPVPDGLDMARARMAPLAEDPDLLVEDKGIALGLHYRAAPAREAEMRTWMQGLLDDLPPGWELQFGKMVVELRPAGATKGSAVRAFMEGAPFAGRRPVTIGDDVTDETMFPVANAMGGLSIRIADPSEPTAATAHLPSPSALRAALERIVS